MPESMNQRLPDHRVQHPTRNRLLAGILVLLALYTCTFAAVLIVPILLALLISLMLAPAVRFACRWHVPRSVATSLVVAMMVALVGTLVASLVGPARDWVTRAPDSIERIERVVRGLLRPLEAATQATEGFARLTEIVDGAGSQRVMEVGSGHLAQLLSATPAVLTSIGVTLLLSFVFLLHGDGLMRKAVALAPELRMKKVVVNVVRDVQHELSVYMLTITLINGLLGLATAAGLWLMGVEQPLLWGGVAAVLNFAPYVGPTMTALALTVVGFSTFQSPLVALCVPGLFLFLHAIEGQWMTPMVVGRRLALDPVVVFLALVVLGWLWGVAGLLMALPLLTCVRIVAARIPAWRPLATLLGTT